MVPPVRARAASDRGFDDSADTIPIARANSSPSIIQVPTQHTSFFLGALNGGEPKNPLVASLSVHGLHFTVCAASTGVVPESEVRELSGKESGIGFGTLSRGVLFGMFIRNEYVGCVVFRSAKSNPVRFKWGRRGTFE